MYGNLENDEQAISNRNLELDKIGSQRITHEDQETVRLDDQDHTGPSSQMDSFTQDQTSRKGAMISKSFITLDEPILTTLVFSIFIGLESLPFDFQWFIVTEKRLLNDRQKEQIRPNANRIRLNRQATPRMYQPFLT
jgi:hypothetical protein